MNSTDVAAWWGALTATVVLVWDVIKWLKLGPKIKTTVRPKVRYPDSKVLSTRIEPDGTTIQELASYCHVEIANVGDRATTILSIEVTHTDVLHNGTIGMSSVGFQFHNGVTLPRKLDPGDSVSARLDMAVIDQMLQRGAPVLELQVAHLARPIKFRIPC